jgi:hypothetical protein
MDIPAIATEQVQGKLNTILSRLKRLGITESDINLDRFSDESELSSRLLANLDRLTKEIEAGLEELERLDQQFNKLDSEARAFRGALIEPIRRRVIDSFNDILNNEGASRDITLHRAIRETASYSNRILGEEDEVIGLTVDEEETIALDILVETSRAVEIPEDQLKEEANKKVVDLLERRNGDEITAKLKHLNNILQTIEADIKVLTDRIENLHDAEYVKNNFDREHTEVINLQRAIGDLDSELSEHVSRLNNADTRGEDRSSSERRNALVDDINTIVKELDELQRVQLFVDQNTDADFARRVEVVKNKLPKLNFSFNKPPLIQQFDESNFLAFPNRYHKLRESFSGFMIAITNPEEIRHLFIALLDKKFGNEYFIKMFVWNSRGVPVDEAETFLKVLTDVVAYFTNELPEEFTSYKEAFDKTITSIKQQFEGNISENNIIAQTATANIIAIVRLRENESKLREITDQIAEIERQQKERKRELQELINQVRQNLEKAKEVQTVIETVVPAPGTKPVDLPLRLPSGETSRQQIIKNAIEDYISIIQQSSSSPNAQEAALGHLLHILDINNSVIQFNETTQRYELVNNSQQGIDINVYDQETYQPIIDELNNNGIIRLGLQAYRLQRRLAAAQRELEEKVRVLGNQVNNDVQKVADLSSAEPARIQSAAEATINDIQAKGEQTIRNIEDGYNADLQAKQADNARLLAERDKLQAEKINLELENRTLNTDLDNLEGDLAKVQTERDKFKTDKAAVEAHLVQERRERFIDSLITALTVNEFALFNGNSSFGQAIRPRRGNINRNGYSIDTEINFSRKAEYNDVPSLTGNDQVSAVHATLKVDDRGIHLTDENSTNGTYIYVNGKWEDLRTKPNMTVDLVEGSIIRITRNDMYFIIHQGLLYPAPENYVEKLTQYNFTSADISYLRRRIQAVLNSPEYDKIRSLTGLYNNLRAKAVGAVNDVAGTLGTVTRINAYGKTGEIENHIRALRDYLGI